MNTITVYFVSSSGVDYRSMLSTYVSSPQAISEADANDDRPYNALVNDSGDNELDDRGQLVRDYTIATRCTFRLQCQRGKYWADNEMGSRFHTIKTLRDAKTKVLPYAREALKALIDDGDVLSVGVGEIEVDYKNGRLAAQIFIDVPGENFIDLGLIELGV